MAPAFVVIAWARDQSGEVPVAAVDLRSLVSKLNDPCRQALEGAAGLTLSRTHYNVEVEHYLLKLLDIQGSDLQACLAHYGVDPGALAADLNRVLDRLKTGNSRPPALAPQIVALVREAWLIASLTENAARVRSGHLLAALLSDDNLAAVAREASGQFARIPGETLRNELGKITAETAESKMASGGPAGGGEAAAGAGGGGAAGGALEQYTVDLTAQAKAGKIDPVLGRDAEIRQVIDILSRRRQNNPILTGEAGVGKTAVVEGFAAMIAAGDVPTSMKNVTLRTLDMGLLQAGAGMKGEFENRLKSVIEEVKASPTPIILFIDEAHTLIGAGGAAGQGDAANLLKPALARGDLRTIGATTWAEYKKYFERDAALTRRFQPVKVEEPDEDNAIAMMRGLVGMLEKHHGVRILDQAVIEAVRLSKRYIPAARSNWPPPPSTSWSAKPPPGPTTPPPWPSCPPKRRRPRRIWPPWRLAGPRSAISWPACAICAAVWKVTTPRRKRRLRRPPSRPRPQRPHPQRRRPSLPRPPRHHPR